MKRNKSGKSGVSLTEYLLIALYLGCMLMAIMPGFATRLAEVLAYVGINLGADKTWARFGFGMSGMLILVLIVLLRRKKALERKLEKVYDESP